MQQHLLDLLAVGAAWAAPILSLTLWLHGRRVAAMTALRASLSEQLAVAVADADRQHQALASQMRDLMNQVQERYVPRREIDRMVIDLRDMVTAVRTDLRDVRAEFGTLHHRIDQVLDRG